MENTIYVQKDSKDVKDKTHLVGIYLLMTVQKVVKLVLGKSYIM